MSLAEAMKKQADEDMARYRSVYGDDNGSKTLDHPDTDRIIAAIREQSGTCRELAQRLYGEDHDNATFRWLAAYLGLLHQRGRIARYRDGHNEHKNPRWVYAPGEAPGQEPAAPEPQQDVQRE
ncbi:UNVERIFIED_CONTAM: hypothetical protein BEN50_19090 [Euhalothece sp. KZN 001]